MTENGHRVDADELERGLIASVIDQRADTEEALGEFRELLATARVEPVYEVVQRRARPDPRTYVGAGKLAELTEQRVFFCPH